MSYQQYLPTSSLSLSLKYLQSSNYYGAYLYAIRFLEMEPYQCEGYLILSLIYNNPNTKYHASFFYEIAFEYNPYCNFSPDLFHDLHLLPTTLSPQQLKDPPSDPPDPYLDALRQSINGNHTLYQIFLSLAQNYPQLVSDSSIYSFELFLQKVNHLLSQTCDETSLPIQIPIPTMNTRLNLSQKWPIYEQIAYIYNWPLIQTVFGETVLGLSDALSRLGIPNAITPSPEKLLSNEVIIKPVGGPKSAGNRRDLNYVIWNFEKNPNVAQEGDRVNIGFILNACAREESAYEYQYFTSSLTYWESIPTSMLKWKAIQPKLAAVLESVGVTEKLPHLVPTFLPLTTIQFSILKTNFRGLFFPFPHP
jgi:hypothetical protein